MPVMTGVELCAWLIEAGHRIPTILVTAYPDEATHDALGEKSDCPRCSCEILAICCSGSGQAARAAAEPSGRPLYAAQSRTQFAEDSSLEGTGFELLVRGRGEAGLSRLLTRRLLGTGRQPAERPRHRDRHSESRYQSRYGHA
jgi:hypothetical protein